MPLRVDPLSIEGKNLLIEDQILSFKSRSHLNEIPYPEKQTEIHAGSYNNILGNTAGAFIRGRSFLGLYGFSRRDQPDKAASLLSLDKLFLMVWYQAYKTLFMLNSAEHEILNAHKDKTYQEIRLF